MEYQIDPQKGYIVIDGYFSARGIKSVKEVVEKRFQNRLKTNYYYDFINWSKTEYEVLVGTYTAPDNLLLFENLDCIFNIHNPDEFVFQKFKLIHSLWNGWIPEGSMSKGNNHVIALKFENEIPEIVYKLYQENQYKPLAPFDSLRLGLCCKNDFPMIVRNIKAHLDNKRDVEKS